MEHRFSNLQGNKAEGYALYWNKKAYIPEIGKYESFCPDSLEIPDCVPLYWQHKKVRPLASSKSGTLRLKKDAIGLKFSADLPKNCEYEKELIGRGDIPGASVSFVCLQEDNSGGHREIKKARLCELSLVASPAHESSVSLRSRKAFSGERHWTQALWCFPE